MAENKKEQKTPVIDANVMVNELVKKAQVALEQFMELTQEQIDEITKAMALAGLSAQMKLARMAVEETGRGIFEDKVTKNIFATEYVYHSIKYDKTVGIINENEDEGYMEVAEPLGVIAGVTPVTNPTSTTMFKSIISMKTRNPIIFGFHPSAQKCSSEAARIVRDAAIAAGAPENCIQWVEYPSIEATSALMNHPGVATILATGGPGMVKAAYSAGKPALGVGAGNVPAFIEKTANLERSLTDLILSKSFDNGMICASEQAAIIEAPIYDKAVAYMKKHGCYFATKEEIKKIEPVVINPEKQMVNPDIVGKYPYEIAALAGITIPKDTKILCCEIEGVGAEYPLSREKLSPVLAVIKAKDAADGIDKAAQMVELGGLGHSSVIHSTDDAIIKAFSDRLKTGRIIVNSPSTHGAIGDIYNTNMPSLTLGCGSYGRNSTTSNVTAMNLINKKRVAMRRTNMQWFKIPEKIYFEQGSVQYLAKMPEISRALIVTDPMMVQLGYVDKLVYQLNKNPNKVAIEVFSDVEPDPDLTTVKKGAEMMNSFKPDVIIALGGGSAMDAGKAMWLFYEHPEADFEGMAQKFLDIRKRVYKFPTMGKCSKFVAIPTTSGTGSEVTSFAVISDKSKNMKYPLADYELTPDVAIIDPEFVMTVPASVTADTGLDVLTHAIEAYVSVLASDYTDALAMKAIQLVFDYLPRSYKFGAKDPEAREKMHNASCIAGMAFTNAFLGINHSLAHKLGAEFHIPHGRANAILLPHVIEYNGETTPTKFMSFPKYGKYVAQEKYAEIAKMLGLPAATPAEGVKSLVKAIRDLIKELNVPMTVKDCGIDEKTYLGAIEDLSYKAFEDQCTTANPRLPKVAELQELYRKAYFGK
ncbi:MAG: bifunctional acetaldehyde-CoA/alcohol dehydrogenase [Zhenhengia sp.]|jgi:acetaldehyde dehydrogenase/alcohol dehydrogenase|uniref:bifunctional acetaldehyde-CoA/alcohol dehydrogenase n=1 Tax=Zhenhengia sp. TaxID=2944208 RepID=UPI00290C773D|nr:bifunctional acetaldehyde-CoA/alcohol dehydrogenase [Clostridiales bacterium]MDU6855090.1 bifunctional acetaldehyde-CoA/alcohol dehydrogenase [Clostridiales bacterium]MDU6974915.1 bifunctional acetaldehyde-CoA/alcohol dehydrogenase [Clostridiales bacterium]